MASESVPFSKEPVFLLTMLCSAFQGRPDSVVLSLIIMASPKTKVLLIKKERRIRVLHQKVSVFAIEAYCTTVNNNDIFLKRLFPILSWSLSKRVIINERV